MRWSPRRSDPLSVFCPRVGGKGDDMGLRLMLFDMFKQGLAACVRKAPAKDNDVIKAINKRGTRGSHIFDRHNRSDICEIGADQICEIGAAFQMAQLEPYAPTTEASPRGR